MPQILITSTGEERACFVLEGTMSVVKELRGTRLQPMPLNARRLILSEDFTGKGQQGNVAGAFDGPRKFTLMLRTGSCLAARANLAVLGDETAQKFCLLIVDTDALIRTELAHPRARKIAPRRGARIVVIHLICHFILLATTRYKGQALLFLN
jgi:hypothetical protein